MSPDSARTAYRRRAPELERKWREAWRAAECFKAPDRPIGAKFFNFDSGPFPNGPLHMGHVRTYVLGDMTARYQRLLGKSVLYATEWDALGLPNEQSALDAHISPREYTAACIRKMRSQLERLGISYDWSRVNATCDPHYYRRTQWLFLRLLENGLAYRRVATTPWCGHCNTSVGAMQTEDGGCSRCGNPVFTRTGPQWFVALSRYSRQLIECAATLDQWSATGRKLLRRSFTGEDRKRGAPLNLTDWHVSRQRAWGTPIPVIHCESCGVVPADRLPVELPDALDWSRASRALAECDRFVHTDCPQCGAAARRETDTLDCLFDDAWSYLSCAASLRGIAGDELPTESMSPWMPVDRFHSGFDTFAYLNLYRFVGSFLHETGQLSFSEPIASYRGHDMVLRDGRKMSKHLGNSVSPESILTEYGADALRVAVLWAAAPGRTIEWSDQLLERSTMFLERIFRLFQARAGRGDAAGLQTSAPTSAVIRLRSAATRHFSRIAEFIEQYRPNAACEVLDRHFRLLERFAIHRIETSRLSAADAAVLDHLLQESAVALAPFAPFLAEEGASMLGQPLLAKHGRWPGAREHSPGD